MTNNKHIVFSDICKKQGWKCTAQRLAVYEFIFENYSHPSIDDAWRHVQKTLPTVTRESIYRIFNELVDAGIIQRLDHLSSARYDYQINSHGHFVCTMCGKITDFALPNNIHIADILNIGNINHIELRASGTCNQCSNKQL